MTFQLASTWYSMRLRTAQVTQREPLEMPGKVRETIRQSRRLGIEAHEHEALPHGRPRRHEAEVLGREVHQGVGVASPSKPPVELVGPGVVRALEADDAALGLGADERAAMATHVVERADDLVLAAHHDQRLPRDLDGHEPSRSIDVLLACHEHPAGPEPRRLLEGQHLGVVEHARRQQARPVDGLTGARDLRGADRRSGHRDHGGR